MKWKLLGWVVAAILVCSVSLTVYWLTEGNPWIETNKVVIVRQLEGDSTVIDVPVSNYAEVLSEFTIRTQVRTRMGTLVKATENVWYVPKMKYKFVTYKQLPIGSYEAQVIVGYQLNPLSYREMEFPLAIIYVYGREDDNHRPAQAIRGP